MADAQEIAQLAHGKYLLSQMRKVCGPELWPFVRAEIRANVPITSKAADAPVFTKAWFKSKTGLSGSHISNMMKAAKVKRAPRGDKNHQWTEKEAARTLRYIVAHSQNEIVRERAKTALSEITP